MHVADQEEDHAITGFITLPDELVLVGWAGLERRLPRDSRIVKESLARANAKVTYR